MYKNGKVKVRPAETIPGRRGEGIKESDGGANSRMIYCENFVNVTLYPSTTTIIIIIKEIHYVTEVLCILLTISPEFLLHTFLEFPVKPSHPGK
jgi:hypothetical protein